MEAHLIEYQMQKMKIVPAIATVWAMTLNQASVQNLYKQFLQELAALKPGAETSKLSTLLADAHALIAGFKSISTWYGEHFGELLKQSCGGMGYLFASGLSRPHLDYGIGVATADGDNHVLLQ